MNCKESCQICVNETSKKSMVTCAKCNFVCCNICVKKYLLESSNMEPICMNCKVCWDLDFLADNTDRKFYNEEYRDHRVKIVLSLEKSLLPATQEVVNKLLGRREHDEFIKKSNMNVRMVNLRKEECYKKIKKYKKKLGKNGDDEKYNSKISVYEDKYNQCVDILKEIRKSIINERDRYKTSFIIEKSLVLEENKLHVIIGPCPVDDCKGYLDGEYKCGICKNEVCKMCRISVHENECDKNLVESVKMISKETKSCPNCKIPIYKTDGCDQMWCINCHTAFSWNTGSIENGRIHNPHYYQWRRENGGLQREPGDIPCGEITYDDVLIKIRYFGVNKETEGYITNVYMMIYHIREHLLIRFYNVTNVADSNKDLRIKYMMGDINQDEWIKELKNRMKVRERKIAMNLLLTMTSNIMEALISNIIISNNLQTFRNIRTELEELNNYVCTHIRKLENRFKTKILKYNERWEIKN